MTECKYCGFGLVMDGVRRCCVAGLDYDTLAAELAALKAEKVSGCPHSKIIAAIDARLRSGWTEELARNLGYASETKVDASELPQAPMPCPGFHSGACVLGHYCGSRIGYAYPCPGQPSIRSTTPEKPHCRVCGGDHWASAHDPGWDSTSKIEGKQ